MILNIGGGGGLPIRLIVTAPTGSAVSVTQGSTVLAANEVDGVWTFAIPSLGVWTIHATIEGQSLTQDVDISKVGQYNVTLEKPVKTTLNDNDWTTIKSVADESKGPNYWAVGDTKQIVINGKLSDGLTLSNYSTWVYIIGFDHNSAVEGTGIAFGGFKTAQTSGIDVALCDSAYPDNKTSGQWFNMSNSNTNGGGWSSSRMRSTTLPLVKSALPSELTSVIKTTSIYSDNTGGGSDVASYVTATQDELYLLAEFEIFGARTYANSAERNYQKQYAYYVAGNSKIKYRHDSTATAVSWWERSVGATYANYFCNVSANGTANLYNATYSFGLAVAFKVGGAKYTPVEYISSTGTQHLDTLFKPNNHTRVVIDFRSTFSTANSPKGLLGSRNSSDVGMFAFLYSNRIDPNYNGVGKSVTVDSLQRHVYDFNQNSFSVDGAAVSFDAGVFSPGYNLLLLSIQNYGTIDNRKAEGYLYSCQIYDNGTLVRDFIPAKDELGNAGLYDKVEGKFYYNAGTGSFGIPGVRTIDSVSVGQSVYCNVNDTKTEFIIVHQGKPSSMYDDSCNGTWLLMKDVYDNSAWNSSNNNRYKTSTIHSYLNNTFLNLLDIKDVIRQAKIPYVDGTGGSAVASGANGLPAKVFLLSGYEVGWTTSDDSSFPVDGARLSYFESGTGTSANNKRIANLHSSAARWWLRSPFMLSSGLVWNIESTGGNNYFDAYESRGIRPAFIVPSDTYIDDDNNILTAPPL